MASILKVNTIQDATNSNTALSIDSSGNVTASNPLTASSGIVHGGYELIEAKMSTAHNQLAGGSAIEFKNVFSTNYIQYKVIIGWYLHAGDSGENIEIRFMSGTNTQNTTSNYRYHVTRQGDTDGVSSYKSSGATKGVVWTTSGGETNGANGGAHGELTIMNTGFYNLGGTSTQRTYSNGTTNVYAPIIYGTMVGFSISGSEYERQDSFIRLNNSQEPSHFTGFCFLTPSSGEAQGTHIAVYGLRTA
tara:strand:- start:39 stop:779 length:741 start_codon:yes stop_codon:yes gene_type:complete